MHTHTPTTRQKTRRLRLAILRASARAIGYVVDGNHVFHADTHRAILDGVFHHYLGKHSADSLSVIEAPERHSPKAQRIAALVAACY